MSLPSLAANPDNPPLFLLCGPVMLVDTAYSQSLPSIVHSTAIGLVYTA